MTPPQEKWRSWRNAAEERQGRQDLHGQRDGALGSGDAVTRIERLLRFALGSSDSTAHALVDTLGQLVEADRCSRQLAARLVRLGAENRELRAALVALRREMQRCGCDIDTE